MLTPGEVEAVYRARVTAKQREDCRKRLDNFLTVTMLPSDEMLQDVALLDRIISCF